MKDQDEYDIYNEILTSESNWNDFEDQNNNILDLLRLFPSIAIGFLEFCIICPKITVK